MTDLGGGDRSDPIPRGARSPRASYGELGRKYNRTKRQLSRALHAIKEQAGVAADTDTLVDSEGNVFIALTGEPIGNLRDEH